MKVKIILGIIVISVIVGMIWIKAERIDNGETPRSFDTSTSPGVEWIKVDKSNKDATYRHWAGEWMTLEDVMKLSEKGKDLSGRDLWKYNFYEYRNDGYQRRYEIEDFGMLFELRVNWILDKTETFTITYDPVETLTVSEAILIARDGLDTQVDFLTGDVEGYIKEHQNNAAYKTFTFAYYPVDVQGTDASLEKIAALWEDGETYVSSNPDEITGIKIDSKEEMYAFVEEMQNELKYTDKAVPENVFLILGQNLDNHNAEPKFLLYIPKGNTMHQYSVLNVEKHGADLYISIKKGTRMNQNVVKDGCLIGLQIVKDGTEPSTIRDVTTIHIDFVEDQ